MTKLFPLLLILCVLPARAELHIVNQVETSFSPQAIEIQEGDTVRWVWSSGGHTVTNGNGSADPQNGALFDAFLSFQDPQFEFTFDDPGVVPYFCRPHELFPMNGTVTVKPAVGIDAPSFGQVKALYGGDQPIR